MFSYMFSLLPIKASILLSILGLCGLISRLLLFSASAAEGTSDGSNTRRSYKRPERAKSVNEEAHVQ